MNDDTSQLPWTTSHVREVVEAVTRGAVSAALAQKAPSIQAPAPPPQPQIDAGELTIVLEDGGSEPQIGKIYAASSGSWVIEVYKDIGISNYFSTSHPIRYQNFSTLSGNFITSVVVLNQLETVGSTGDAVMVTYNESYGASSTPPTATEPSGNEWTKQAFTIHAGTTATYDGQAAIGVLYRAYDPSSKRVVEQWFRGPSFPTMTASTKLWLIVSENTANEEIASLNGANGVAWQIRRYAYHMRTTTTPP